MAVGITDVDVLSGIAEGILFDGNLVGMNVCFASS
jgi:hypothetical protein